MTKRRIKKNFRLLDKFTCFVPDFRQLVVLVLWFILGAVLSALVITAMTLVCGPEIGQEYLLLCSYPVMFIPPMIYASIKSSLNSGMIDGVKLDRSHFAPVGAAVCVILAVAGTLALSFVCDWVCLLLPQMPESLKNIFSQMTGGNIVVDLICVSVFAPFFEEWLCRGMVMRGMLSHGMKPVWAIVISAAFFAIIHGNPWQAIPAFMVGALFGYVYYKTGSLRLTMLMHCANNTLAVIVGNIDTLSKYDNWSEMFDSATYSALVAACFAVVVLVCFKFRKVEKC